jgi:lauroyl/myristoyl acyltransferase
VVSKKSLIDVFYNILLKGGIIVPSSIKKSRHSGSWSSSLAPVFRIISFVHKYRIFRPYLYLPTSPLNFWGVFFGKVFLSNKKTYRKLYAAIDAVYGKKISHKQRKRIAQGNVNYMGILLMDAMLHSPNIYTHTLDRFISFKNIYYLDDALKQGRGAIVVSMHMGMFFHVIAGLTYHPRKYEIATVIQPANRVMYENIVNRPDAQNLHTIASQNYEETREYIENHLKNNGILIVLHDYSKLSHFRAPFWYGKYPYLMTTPQSALSMHKTVRSPIIPAIIHPNGEIGNSTIEFLNPSPLSETSKKFYNSDDRVFRGELSLEINRYLAPFIIKYLHVWEEIQNFNLRISDSIEFPKKLKIGAYIDVIEQKISSLLVNSYERNRPDGQLHVCIQQMFPLIKNSLQNPEQIINDSHKAINLEQLSGLSQMIEMLCGLSRCLLYYRESKSHGLLLKMTQEFSEIVENSKIPKNEKKALQLVIAERVDVSSSIQ